VKASGDTRPTLPTIATVARAPSTVRMAAERRSRSRSSALIFRLRCCCKLRQTWRPFKFGGALTLQSAPALLPPLFPTSGRWESGLYLVPGAPQPNIWVRCEIHVWLEANLKSCLLQNKRITRNNNKLRFFDRQFAQFFSKMCLMIPIFRSNQIRFYCNRAIPNCNQT
jgi:hypothetical protein